MQKKKEIIDLTKYEKVFLAEGNKYIGGMDEVGRGPLAGPVVVACVVMPLDSDKIIEGVTDSKKLTPKKREELFSKITKIAKECIVMMADPKEIDTINILNATKNCMNKCIESLSSCDIVLVDAVKLTNTKIPTFSIIKGDEKSYSIGAASIVAKVVRDRIMKEQDAIYPQYDFKNNKGYGTPKHIEALKMFGPCPIHRKTFITNFFQKQESIFDL